MWGLLLAAESPQPLEVTAMRDGLLCEKGKGKLLGILFAFLPPGQTVSPQSAPATNLEVKNGGNCEHSPVDLSKVRRRGTLASVSSRSQDWRCVCGKGITLVFSLRTPSLGEAGSSVCLTPVLPAHLQVVKAVLCGYLLMFLMLQTLGGCD